MRNVTDATSSAETASSSGVPQFTPVKSLFLFFFFCHALFVPFQSRLLITTLVSSNFYLIHDGCHA